MGSPDNPTFCLCAAPQSSPSAADQAQSNNYPRLALCLAPPIHQTKPIGHGPSSGLALYIFSSPARLRSPSLPAYTCCRRAAKLKMLCIMVHNFSAIPMEVKFAANAKFDVQLVNLLSDDHSTPDASGKHSILLEPYGYRWFRIVTAGAGSQGPGDSRSL